MRFFPTCGSSFATAAACLLLGFLLMVINRVSGLVLPYSTKYLIDSVIIKQQCATAQAAGARSAWRDPDSRSHVIFADPVAVESGTAADHGTAAEGSSAYWMAADLVPRFD